MSRVITALLAALLLAGCGSAATPGGAPTSSVPPAPSSTSAGASPGTPVPAAEALRERLQAVLDQRARAVRSGRQGRYDATVGGDRAAQDAAYTTLRRLPLAAYSLTLGLHDAARTTATTYVATVAEQTRLVDIDPRPVEVDHTYTFTRAGGTWRVASDRPDRTRISAAPWEAPGAVVDTLGTLVIVTQGVSKPEHDRLVLLAGLAFRADQAVLPGHLPGAVVMMFADGAPLRTEGIPRQELSLLGGVTVAESVADTSTVDLRAIIAPDMFDDPRRDLVHVIRHELVHVALKQYGGPAWVREGAAEYYAWKRAPEQYLSWDAIDAAYAGRPRHLPEDVTFHAGGERAWNVNYGISWWAFEALARHHHATPLDLMQAIRRTGDWQEAPLDHLLRTRYGISGDQLVAEARALIRHDFARR